MTDTSSSQNAYSGETLNAARQDLAKEYAARKRKLFIVELLLGGSYVLIWIFGGLAPVLRSLIYTVTTNMWLSVPLFALGFGLPYIILTFPLDFYGGYVLPHHYGQSTQSLGGWIMDQLKGFVLAGVLGLIVLLTMYGLMAYAPQTWWLWTGLFLLLFTVVLSNLAPVLIFPLFFKYKPLEDEALVERLTTLAEQAGTKVEGVYAFDMSSKTVAANAALMGLGNTRRIVLGDTLLEKFTPEEIETVLAHELGHQVNRDIPLGIIVQSAITLLGLWIANLVMWWGVETFGYFGLSDPATLPLLILAMSIFGLLTMPLTNMWSRWREVKADTYALETTHNPQAFISAMTRLANQNLAEAQPPAWVEFLLHSHPSIQHRVAMANAFAGAKSAS